MGKLLEKMLWRLPLIRSEVTYSQAIHDTERNVRNFKKFECDSVNFTVKFSLHRTGAGQFTVVLPALLSRQTGIR